MLEDALCLVFLEFQLAGLAAKTAEDKTINALQKSWQKMTEAAPGRGVEIELRRTRKSLAATRAQRLIRAHAATRKFRFASLSDSATNYPS